VTSSFDAGHQFEVMEVLRTQVGKPLNPDGLQVIILSHDGLLEKYFDKLANTKDWHHQHMQGLPPAGSVMDGPHIFGFSAVALCINFTSALASARLARSVRASMNAATLNLVGLVLFSAIVPALRRSQA
jgi:hypothetical protein